MRKSFRTANDETIDQIIRTRRAIEALEENKEERARDAGVFRKTNQKGAVQKNVDSCGYVLMDVGDGTGLGAMNASPNFDLTFRQYTKERKMRMKKSGSWRAR